MSVSTTFLAYTAGKQGAQGASQRSGAGAPANSLGSDGDSYLDSTTPTQYDERAAGVWPAGVSLLGAKGPTGPAAVAQSVQGAFNLLDGLPVGYSSSTALSSSYQVLNYPANPFTSKFWCRTAGALYAVVITVGGSPSNCVFNFADLGGSTPNSFWTSPAINAPGTYTYTPGATGAPITMGDNATAQADWRVMGSGSITCIVQPIYMNTSAIAISAKTLNTAGFATPTALSANAQTLTIMGTTTPMTFVPATTAYMMTAAFYNGSGASATFSLMNATTGLAVYSRTVTGQTDSVGPFGSSAINLIAGNVYYWQVTGSGTGIVYVDTRVVS